MYLHSTCLYSSIKCSLSSNGMKVHMLWPNVHLTPYMSPLCTIAFTVQDIIYARCKLSGHCCLFTRETCQHFSTHVREHLARDKNSNIYKHLTCSKTCKETVSNESCFTILDTAKCSYDLKIKEALHINSLKPTLNSQLSHATLTLDLYSYKFSSFFFYCYHYHYIPRCSHSVAPFLCISLLPRKFMILYCTISLDEPHCFCIAILSIDFCFISFQWNIFCCKTP